MTNQTVLVYSTPTCPYCRMAKAYFQEKGVTYKDIDVSLDQKFAEEMIKKSGQMGVPVLDINGTIIIGFDKKKINQALGINS